MLLDKDSTELGKRRGRRAILEDPEQERTLADVQAKNADVSAVRAFEAVGQGVAIDELRELEDVGPGMGRPARYIGATVRSFRRGMRRGAPPAIPRLHRWRRDRAADCRIPGDWLKACSSPGALSAPSPEGAPRGVLGTSAEGKV